jgi:CRP/FNR family transcriptional regulator, anaerobic regulatory protein
MDLATAKIACSNCNMRELCLPIGLTSEEMRKLDALVGGRRHIERKGFLYRNGDPFRSLYAIRTGFFKTTITAADGRDQVTGFQMAGEILGFEGIVNDQHPCDAVALEDSEVCVIPFDSLQAISREVNALAHHVYKIMSREIVRDQGVMMLLGSMNAEERLAGFLLNLAKRLQARGFSSTEFILRMTREEIGSFLGMKLETVSRTMSKFADDGLIEVKQRQIRIAAPDALAKVVNPTVCQ